MAGRSPQTRASGEDRAGGGNPPSDSSGDARALDLREASQKPRKGLLEYTLGVGEPGIVERLHRVGDTRTAVFYREDLAEDRPGHPRGVVRFDSERFAEQSGVAQHRALKPSGGTNPKPILAECHRHGVDHRSTTNETPLMLAATVGNRKLVRTLLEAGADTLAEMLGLDLLRRASKLRLIPKTAPTTQEHGQVPMDRAGTIPPAEAAPEELPLQPTLPGRDVPQKEELISDSSRCST